MSVQESKELKSQEWLLFATYPGPYLLTLGSPSITGEHDNNYAISWASFCIDQNFVQMES